MYEKQAKKEFDRFYQKISPNIEVNRASGISGDSVSIDYRNQKSVLPIIASIRNATTKIN